MLSELLRENYSTFSLSTVFLNVPRKQFGVVSCKSDNRIEPKKTTGKLNK